MWPTAALAALWPETPEQIQLLLWGGGKLSLTFALVWWTAQCATRLHAARPRALHAARPRALHAARPRAQQVLPSRRQPSCTHTMNTTKLNALLFAEKSYCKRFIQVCKLCTYICLLWTVPKFMKQLATCFTTVPTWVYQHLQSRNFKMHSKFSLC